MIRIQVVLLCAALALSVGIASAGAGGGNSDNAKLCQSGWQSWLRADGTPFANRGACVSYAAHGGILTTFTTSTTSHTTFTRVDLPTIQAYLTRVISSTDAGVTAYDSFFLSSPGSNEVSAAFAAAREALYQALVVESTVPPNHGVGAIAISLPALVSSSQTSETVFVGNQPDHTQTSTTTTTTVGPATIFIGPDQSQAFSVVAGTQNINTDTHTESFVNQVYQTTVTNRSTYVLTGSFTPT